MSCKWFRMLFSPHNGNLGQIGLRRTAPQSKTISKAKQPIRSSVQQQNVKLNLIKRNMAMMEELTQRKTPNKMSRSTHLFSRDSQMGRSRQTSRCHIRSMGSLSKWNLRPAHMNPQSSLSKKINTIERFYEITKENKKTPCTPVQSTMKIGVLGKTSYLQGDGVSDMNTGFLTRPMPGGNAQVRGFSNWQKPIFPANYGKSKHSSAFKPSNNNIQIVKNTIKSGISGYARKCLVSGVQAQEKAPKPTADIKPERRDIGYSQSTISLRKSCKAVDLMMKDLPQPQRPHSAKPPVKRPPYDITTAYAFTKSRDKLTLPNDKQKMAFSSGLMNEKTPSGNLPKTTHRQLTVKESANDICLKPCRPVFHLEKNADNGKLEIREVKRSVIKKKIDCLPDVVPAELTERAFKSEYLVDLTPAQRLLDFKPKDVKKPSDENIFDLAAPTVTPAKPIPQPVPKPVIRCSKPRTDLLDEDAKLVWQKKKPFKRINVKKGLSKEANFLKSVIPSLNIHNPQASQSRLSHTSINGRTPHEDDADKSVVGRNQPYQSFGEIAKQNHLFEYIPKAKPRMKITYPMYSPTKPVGLGNRPSTWIQAIKTIRKTDPADDANASSLDEVKPSETITGFLPQSTHSPKVLCKKSKCDIRQPRKEVRGAHQLFTHRIPKQKQVPTSPNSKKPFSVSSENIFKNTLKKCGLKSYCMGSPSQASFRKESNGLKLDTISMGSTSQSREAQIAQKANKELMDSKEEKSTKVTPCRDCGLFHIASTKGACPITEWMKTSEVPTITQAMPMNTVFKRAFSTTASRNIKIMFPNRTDELISVCKYCGMVHSGSGHQCPMTEAVKLFTPPKKKIPFTVIHPCNLNKMPNKDEVTKRVKNAKNKLCVMKPIPKVPEKKVRVTKRGLRSITKPYKRNRMSATMKALHIQKHKFNKTLVALFTEYMKPELDQSGKPKVNIQDSLYLKVNQNLNRNVQDGESYAPKVDGAQLNKHFCKTKRAVFEYDCFLSKHKQSPTTLRVSSEEGKCNIDSSRKMMGSSSGSRNFNTFAPRNENSPVNLVPPKKVSYRDKRYNGRIPKYINRMQLTNKCRNDDNEEHSQLSDAPDKLTAQKPKYIDRIETFMSLAETLKSNQKKNEACTSLGPGVGLFKKPMQNAKIPEFQVREQRMTSCMQKLKEEMNKANAESIVQQKSEPVLTKRIMITIGSPNITFSSQVAESEVFFHDREPPLSGTPEPTSEGSAKGVKTMCSPEIDILASPGRQSVMSAKQPSRTFSTNNLKFKVPRSPLDNYKPAQSPEARPRSAQHSPRHSKHMSTGRREHNSNCSDKCGSGSSDYNRKLCNKEGVKDAILELMNIKDTCELDLIQARLKKNKPVGKEDEFYKHYRRDNQKTKSPHACSAGRTPSADYAPEGDVICEEPEKPEPLICHKAEEDCSESNKHCVEEEEKKCKAKPAKEDYCDLTVTKSVEKPVIDLKACSPPPVEVKPKEIPEEHTPEENAVRMALAEERESGLLKAVKTRQKKDTDKYCIKRGNDNIFSTQRGSKYLKYYDEEAQKKFKYLEKRSENLYENYEDDPLYRLPLRRNKSSSDKKEMTSPPRAIRKDRSDRYKSSPDMSPRAVTEKKSSLSQSCANASASEEGPVKHYLSSGRKAGKFMFSKPSTQTVSELVTEDCRSDELKEAEVNVRGRTIQPSKKLTNRPRSANNYDLKDSIAKLTLSSKSTPDDIEHTSKSSSPDQVKEKHPLRSESGSSPAISDEVNQNLLKIKLMLKEKDRYLPDEDKIIFSEEIVAKPKTGDVSLKIAADEDVRSEPTSPRVEKPDFKTVYNNFRRREEARCAEQKNKESTPGSTMSERGKADILPPCTRLPERPQIQQYAPMKIEHSSDVMSEREKRLANWDRIFSPQGLNTTKITHPEVRCKADADREESSHKHEDTAEQKQLEREEKIERIQLVENRPNIDENPEKIIRVLPSERKDSVVCPTKLLKSDHATLKPEYMEEIKKTYVDPVKREEWTKLRNYSPCSSLQKERLADSPRSRRNSFVDKEIKKMEELADRLRSHDDIRLYRLNSEEFLLRVKSPGRSRSADSSGARKRPIELKSSPEVLELNDCKDVTARVEPQVVLTVRDDKEKLYDNGGYNEQQRPRTSSPRSRNLSPRGKGYRLTTAVSPDPLPKSGHKVAKPVTRRSPNLRPKTVEQEWFKPCACLEKAAAHAQEDVEHKYPASRSPDLTSRPTAYGSHIYETARSMDVTPRPYAYADHSYDTAVRSPDSTPRSPAYGEHNYKTAVSPDSTLRPTGCADAYDTSVRSPDLAPRPTACPEHAYKTAMRSPDSTPRPTACPEHTYKTAVRSPDLTAKTPGCAEHTYKSPVSTPDSTSRPTTYVCSKKEKGAKQEDIAPENELQDKLGYAGLTKSQVETVCENVLRDIETMQMMNQMRGINLKPSLPAKVADKVDKIEPVKDLANVPKDELEASSSRSQPSWKYLVYDPEVYQVRKDDTSSTKKIGKCMQEVRRCLDDYKKCLVDLKLMPHWDEHFDYVEYEKLSSSTPNLSAGRDVGDDEYKYSSSLSPIALLTAGKLAQSLNTPRSSTSLFSQRSRQHHGGRPQISQEKLKDKNDYVMTLSDPSRLNEPTISDVSIDRSRVSVNESKGKLLRKVPPNPSKTRGFHQTATEVRFNAPPPRTSIRTEPGFESPVQNPDKAPRDQDDNVEVLDQVRFSVPPGNQFLNVEFLFHSKEAQLSNQETAEIETKPVMPHIPLAEDILHEVKTKLDVRNSSESTLKPYMVAKRSLSSFHLPVFADEQSHSTSRKRQSVILADVDINEGSIKPDSAYFYTKFSNSETSQEKPVDLFQHIFESTSKKLQNMKKIAKDKLDQIGGPDRFWPQEHYPRAYQTTPNGELVLDSGRHTMDADENIGLRISRPINDFRKRNVEVPDFSLYPRPLSRGHQNTLYARPPSRGNQNKDESKNSQSGPEENRSLTNILKEACLDLKKHTEKACQDLKKSFQKKPQKD